MPTYFTSLLVGVLSMFTTLWAQNFTDVTAIAGTNAVAIDPALMAGGVAWFDYNNDHYPDLLLTNGLAATRLYRNNWDGTFTDVSEAAGLLSVSGAMGAVSRDFDGDGFTDLFITTLAGQPNVLLRNNGEGGFVNISRNAGVSEISYGASVTVGDYDADGDPDIYVANYLAGAEVQDGGQPNLLYRNDGDFTFTEVAQEWSLDDDGCGLGVITTDLNNDGLLDLYLANDFGNQIKPNEHFQNTPDGFVRRAFGNGTAATINAMGIATGDYDNDGDVDLYITNIRENPLFENTLGGDFFNFASFSANVALPELTSWGTSFTDFDLDGYLDLMVANGQIAELVNEGEPQRYYHNNGDGTFTDLSVGSGLDEIVAMGRGLAVADYDLDGYPDVAIQVVQSDRTGAEAMTLLHNEGSSNGKWLAVAAPYGAQRLTLHAGGMSWMREVDGGSSYLSQSGGPVHFGAPEGSPSVDSVVVTFAHRPAISYPNLEWSKLIGLRPDGSSFQIQHLSRQACGETPSAPTVARTWDMDDRVGEVLRLERTENLAFSVLPELTVALSVGEFYDGVARTQDARLMDTIATGGPCPSLQPIQLKVLPANEQPVIYPNPLTGNTLSIILPLSANEVDLTLWSASGSLVYQQAQELSSAQRTLITTIPDFPSGLYLLEIEIAGKTTYHKLTRP